MVEWPVLPDSPISCPASTTSRRSDARMGRAPPVSISLNYRTRRTDFPGELYMDTGTRFFNSTPAFLWTRTLAQRASTFSTTPGGLLRGGPQAQNNSTRPRRVTQDSLRSRPDRCKRRSWVSVGDRRGPFFSALRPAPTSRAGLRRDRTQSPNKRRFGRVLSTNPPREGGSKWHHRGSNPPLPLSQRPSSHLDWPTP